MKETQTSGVIKSQMSLVCIPIFPLPRSYTRLTSNWLSPRLSVMPAARPRVSLPSLSHSRPFPYFANIDYCLPPSTVFLSLSLFLGLSFIPSVYLFPFLSFSFSRRPLLSLSLSLFLPPAQTSRGNKTRVREYATCFQVL